MEEIKVGEYVRYIASFKNNNINKPIVKIGKILNLNNYCIELDTFKGGVYNTKDFKNIIIGKPSNSIIDLIEVGDYVDSLRVVDRDKNYIILETFDERILVYKNEPIKSIVTKEQFKSIEYEVK